MNNPSNNLYRDLSKAIFLAAAVFVSLWVLAKIVTAVLILLFALVLIIIINKPVAILQAKGIKRGLACAIVFGIIVLALALLGWLVVPRVSEQFNKLMNDLPGYLDNLSRQLGKLFNDIPGTDEKIKEESSQLSSWLPSMPQALLRIGNYSLSLLSGLVVFIIFISMIVYAVINPAPLLETYFLWFPASKREAAYKAYQDASNMLTGWFKANLIGGGIEAVCTVVFLSLMNVPGAWVWGALALFAELVPKIGFYIMAVPPILVAISVSPATAMWVTVYFLALNEIIGDFVMPKLRSSTMKLHPVSTLFMVLAMAMAFGFIGALLATPLAAIIKAYYYAFFVKGQENSVELKNYVEQAQREIPK
jgi:putative permease